MRGGNANRCGAHVPAPPGDWPGGDATVWTRHWRLANDPFLGPGAPYVRTSGHDEAVARLVESIESCRRLAVIRAGAGFGKSVVVSRALGETRGPRRRSARVVGPVDGAAMMAALAAGLGVRAPAPAGRSAAWKALTDAVRLARWQDFQTVLVVEDAQFLVDEADRRDLQRLTHLDPHQSGRLTVVLSFLERDDPWRIDDVPGAENPPSWELVIGLPALTRTETARYVREKLASAGRDEAAFTPRALSALHELSGGVPRGIDRLGSLALMAAAVRRLEMVTPDVLHGVAHECRRDGDESAA